MGMQLNEKVKSAETVPSLCEDIEMEVLPPQPEHITGLPSALSEVEGEKEEQEEQEEEDGERSMNGDDDEDDDNKSDSSSSSGASSSSVFVADEKTSKKLMKFQARSNVTSHSSYGSEDASIDEAQRTLPYHTKSHNEDQTSLNSRHRDSDGGFGGLPYHLNCQRKESEGYQSMLPTPTQDVTFQFPSHSAESSLSRGTCNYKVYENITSPDLEKVKFSYP